MRGRAARLAAAALAASVLLPTASASGGESRLQRAARAARETTFVGVAEISWHDGERHQRHSLTVRGGDGALMVRGDNSVLLAPGQDLFVERDGGWDVLWPSGTGTGAQPPLADKYRLEESPGPVVGGRPTTAVAVHEGDVLRERLYLDNQSGLLLGRVQLGPGATVGRSMTFEVITVGEGTTSPTVPSPAVPSPTGRRPAQAIGAGDLPARFPAPATLADGYRRLGVYRHASFVHVRYGDGLYELSVFEQPGRLDRGALPDPGRPVEVGGTTGWHYEWAGGHVLVWEAGQVVFGAVSDAPFDHVVGAARSLPAGAGSGSLVNRLRRLCRALLQPLAG